MQARRIELVTRPDSSLFQPGWYQGHPTPLQHPRQNCHPPDPRPRRVTCCSATLLWRRLWTTIAQLWTPSPEVVGRAAWARCWRQTSTRRAVSRVGHNKLSSLPMRALHWKTTDTPGALANRAYSNCQWGMNYWRVTCEKRLKMRSLW